MPIGVVVLGCGISVTGEMYFSGIGLALLLLSVFFRGLKAVMQQKLMTGETKEKFDPVTLMAWTCLCAFMVVILYSALTEGAAPWVAIANTSDVFGLILALLGSCVIACTLNISALFVIKQLGGASMQIIGKLNTIMIVAFSVTFLHERLQGKVIMGTCLICTGVAIFEFAEKVEKDRIAAKQSGPILPHAGGFHQKS